VNETYRRIAPVLASIVIIIVIAVLRERSKLLAAITATMPINITLALWIVTVSDGTDQETVVSFVRSMVIGVIGTLIWLLAVWLAARAGWAFPRLLLVGYLAWGIAIGGIFALQSFLGSAFIFSR